MFFEIIRVEFDETRDEIIATAIKSVYGIRWPLGNFSNESVFTSKDRAAFYYFVSENNTSVCENSPRHAAT